MNQYYVTLDQLEEVEILTSALVRCETADEFQAVARHIEAYIQRRLEALEKVKQGEKAIRSPKAP